MMVMGPNTNVSEPYRKTPSTFYLRMGRLIRSLRKQRRMSPIVMSKSIGVTRQTVDHWEAGSRRVPAERIPDLCKVLDCTPHYLLGMRCSVCLGDPCVCPQVPRSV